jgi:uncharacterized integral membrane protein (TIGR00697 family)
MNEEKSENTLYHILSAAFCVIVVMSNIISAKMIKLPFFADSCIPAGLLTYPLTFLISDLVTEIFGAKKAKSMVYIAFGMNLLGFAILYAALRLPAISMVDERAFQAVLGLSGLRIFSSLTAFLAAQIVDIQLYALIKRWTGEHHLWLRNNASTCVSQIVDTVAIDILYLFWGLGMGMEQVLPIMLISYAYKAFCSFANTPLFYLSVFLVKFKWRSLFQTANAT